MTAKTDLHNRRTGARRKVIKAGKIVFNEGRSFIECRVRDLSVHGARLEVATLQLLPHRFELHLTTGPVGLCQLRWARGLFVGVRFLGQIR